MVVLNKVFKPDFNYDLLRVGSKHDGGYLIEKNSLYTSDFLLSFGISTNWIFEEQFLKKQKVPLIAFDGSINENFWKSKKKEALKKLKYFSINKYIEYLITKNKFNSFFNQKNFIPKYISKSLDNSIPFNMAIKLAKGTKIFLKIDIEGSEYELLNELIENQNLIAGLAIEFHSFHINEQIIIDFINEFSLKIVHVHINNYDFDPKGLLKTIEVSFSKDPIIKGEFNQLPHPFDRPNNKKREEIKINFE